MTEPGQVNQHQTDQPKDASRERWRIPRTGGGQTGEGLRHEQNTDDEKTHRAFSFHHFGLERHA